MKRASIIVTTLTLSLLMVIAGCSNAEETMEEIYEVPVAVAEIQTGSLMGNNRINGLAAAGSDIDIIPQAVGELKEILVANGETVEKGQVIAKLDDFDARTALQNDQAQLNQAKNNLERARNGKVQAEHNLKQSEENLKQAKNSLIDATEGRDQNLRNLELDLANAEKAYEDTKVNLERMERLYEEGFISKQQLEEVEAGELRARSALEQLKIAIEQAESETSINTIESTIEQAKINIDSAAAGIRDAEISVQDAQIAVEQANLAVEISQKRLDDTQIKAPVSGEITSLNADVGQYITNQGPFARLISLDVIDVKASISAGQLMLFEIGDEVIVQFSGLDKDYEGVVTYLSSTAEDSGLFTVEVRVANEAREIKAGMVATINVEETLVEDSLIVPSTSILERQDRTYIYIVEDTIAREVDVEVIRYDTEFSAVIADIEPGELVIVKGQNLLSDGEAIRIVEEG